MVEEGAVGGLLYLLKTRLQNVLQETSNLLTASMVIRAEEDRDEPHTLSLP